MLKLGTQNIPALYLGGEQIKKAYLGDTVVLGAGTPPPSRLPEGYTEVEYIQSSGTQKINTGQKPVATLKVIMDVETLAQDIKSSRYFVGTQYVNAGSYNYVATMYINYTGILGAMGRYYAGGSATTKTITTDTTPRRMKISMDWPNSEISVNEDKASISNNYVTSAFASLALLDGLVSRLYSCQMYLSDEAGRDFVPCVDPNGAVGLYDLVEGKFYGNAGTGAFTAGPAV